MSGNDVSKQFETEFATWIGRQYALSYPNGTDALRSAMWAVGLSAGDEIICPTITYWASCTQALSLGVAVNFADIDPQTLCIDPNDIEHRIGPRTRAIMVVHYCARACDMDPILAIAKRHNLAVIEDVSHAQGTLYKGRKVGTFGTVAAMSMMTGKAFPIGEGGMLVTNDRMVYERCISYGFYERTGAASNFNAVDRQVFDEELSHFAGIPLGGYKHRLNQLAAAMGRVQLRHYDERVKEIDNAMRRFWSLLEDVPGIAPHLANRAEGSTMGGWYIPVGLYRPDELGGLPVARFCEAVRAEGVATCIPGINTPLHLHPVFHTADVFRMGRPTMISFGQRDVRQGPNGSSPTRPPSAKCASTPCHLSPIPKPEFDGDIRFGHILFIVLFLASGLWRLRPLLTGRHQPLGILKTNFIHDLLRQIQGLQEREEDLAILIPGKDHPIGVPQQKFPAVGRIARKGNPG